MLSLVSITDLLDRRMVHYSFQLTLQLPEAEWNPALIMSNAQALGADMSQVFTEDQSAVP